MSKLIIPAAEIIGTPLTPEELKGILAGSTQASKCSCHMEDKYGGTVTAPQAYYEVSDQDACTKKCNEVCDSLSSCARVTKALFC